MAKLVEEGTRKLNIMHKDSEKLKKLLGDYHEKDADPVKAITDVLGESTKQVRATLANINKIVTMTRKEA